VSISGVAWCASFSRDGAGVRVSVSVLIEPRR
jgi:hypothetical protein